MPGRGIVTALPELAFSKSLALGVALWCGRGLALSGSVAARVSAHLKGRIPLLLKHKQVHTQPGECSATAVLWPRWEGKERNAASSVLRGARLARDWSEGITWPLVCVSPPWFRAGHSMAVTAGLLAAHRTNAARAWSPGQSCLHAALRLTQNSVCACGCDILC